MKKTLKLFYKAVLSIILLAVSYFVIVISVGWLTYFNPPKIDNIANFHHPDQISTDSVYSCMIWNIGYGGLGEGMDFFYDGGKMVRDTRSNVLFNLQNINNIIYFGKDSIDFYMIQEVDLKSKRSYGINEVELICNRLGKCIKSFALNYDVAFVPLPLFSPMGKTKSGVLNISKKTPLNATRYGFQGDYGWPTKLFMLKRCFLANRYETSNGKEFILVNIHNSAYDEGHLRLEQVQALRNFAQSEYQKGNYVLLGGDWNQYPPSFQPKFSGFPFDDSNTAIHDSIFSNKWQWAFDPSVPTNRSLQSPLHEGTPVQVIDFFLASPNIKVIEIKGIDGHFRYTDHNPVFIKYKLL
jgi:endonuclease/exonuclease/phosphatase family metal-dependent hydrolase